MRVPQLAVQAFSQLKVRRSSLGRGQADLGGFKMSPSPGPGPLLLAFLTSGAGDERRRRRRKRGLTKQPLLEFQQVMGMDATRTKAQNSAVSVLDSRSKLCLPGSFLGVLPFFFRQGHPSQGLRAPSLRETAAGTRPRTDMRGCGMFRVGNPTSLQGISPPRVLCLGVRWGEACPLPRCWAFPKIGGRKPPQVPRGDALGLNSRSGFGDPF